MKLETLWENLTPNPENINTIKKDLSVGIAPHLPYFIIGLNDRKSKLYNYLTNIDTSFQFCLIKGQYGNGKTNLLKYLEYFFDVHSEYNVHCETWRADVDKYDLNLFLLYILQQRHASILHSFLKLSSEEVLKEACNNYKGGFSVLKSYSEVICAHKDNDDALTEIIQLGTGVKYDKRSFDKYYLTKFSDYNRHEVLVFFLNILAQNNYYILFCIDELEKIEEKSRARFQSYLTSFRELIDMSGLIKGHMIIASMTDAGKFSSMPLEAYNPAFARRIVSSTYELKSITNTEDIKQLALSLCTILQESCKDTDIDLIVSKVVKQHLSHTNEVVISLYKNLTECNYKSWRDKLHEANLDIPLQQRMQALYEEGVDIRINSKFFAPLENYINIVCQNPNEYQIKAQMYQTIRSVDKLSCYIFLFTTDYDANLNRIKNVNQLFPNDKLYIFKPEGLSISNSVLLEEGLNNIEDVVVYNPIELMALLTLFVENYDNDTLKDIIVECTKGL